MLAGTLLLALGVRLLLWSLPPHLAANDETEYLAVARDLLAGRGWRFYNTYPWLRAPLYPLWLAGSLWLTGGDAQRALLPNIALSTLHIYLLWLLGCALASRPERAERTGLWTAVGGTLLLTLATFANLWMAETLWNVLWTTALLLLIRWWRVPSWHTAALAGVFIGLTILTRSVPLLFLPLLAGWMLWRLRNRRGIIHVLALIVACGLVVAPWTWRNWRAYGTPILVETGFAYNLWAFSEPPLDLGQINAILAAIPNPAARADYASAQGQALIRADPTILLRKPWPNTIYFWRVKPIQDRFLQQNYYSDVRLSYFIVALVFDDGWYLIILALAAWGIGRTQRDGRLVLALLWLGYVLGTTMFTHGEARYRHFIWPILLAYAAQTLARDGVVTAWRGRMAAGVVGAGLILLVLTFYPWAWAQTNIERALKRNAAERALAAGNFAQAEALAVQALEREPSPDGWMLVGRVKAAKGDGAGAIQAYGAAVNDKRDYPPATLALGAYLLAQNDPDNARTAWANEYVDQTTLNDLAWRERIQPAASRIDVGDGLDLGLVQGVYPAEELLGTRARWTNGAATIRLPAGPPRRLTLRLADPRPVTALPSATVLCVAPHQCTTVQLDNQWRIIHLPLPAHTAEWQITITTTAWYSPADERKLGIVLDWAAVNEE